MKAKSPARAVLNTPVVVRPAEEKLSDQIGDLEHNMRALLRVSSNATATIIEKFQNAYTALNTLEWMETHATNIALGALAETVAAYTDANRSEPMNIVDAIEAVVTRERDSLMRNQYRGTSTSAWHNAAEGAKREAATRFVCENGRCIERIRKLQAEIAAKHTS